MFKRALLPVLLMTACDDPSFSSICQTDIIVSSNSPYEGEHDPSLAVDGDPNTYWQPADGSKYYGEGTSLLVRQEFGGLSTIEYVSFHVGLISREAQEGFDLEGTAFKLIGTGTDEETGASTHIIMGYNDMATWEIGGVYEVSMPIDDADRAEYHSVALQFPPNFFNGFVTEVEVEGAGPNGATCDYTYVVEETEVDTAAAEE